MCTVHEYMILMCHPYLIEKVASQKILNLRPKGSQFQLARGETGKRRQKVRRSEGRKKVGSKM